MTRTWDERGLAKGNLCGAVRRLGGILTGSGVIGTFSLSVFGNSMCTE